MTNHLYYGDNLTILREHIKDESIDLIYLDPPFNSQATYNVLFRSPAGQQSPAQIEAFEDTWHWTDEAEEAFDEMMTSGNTDAAEMLRAMRSFLKENDMMAYLTKTLMARLATCQWVRERHNVLITGPTGIGKTWLGCALGHKACREGLTALSLRLPRFLQELPIAKGDGRYGKVLTALAKTDVLILDDWGLAPLSEDNRRDLLEIVEDRHDCRATIITS